MKKNYKRIFILLLILSFTFVQHGNYISNHNVSASAYEARINSSNILPNGSFEICTTDSSKFEHWTFSEQGAQVSSDAYSGNYALSLTGNTAFAKSDAVSVHDNTEYTFTGKIWVENNATATLKMLDGQVTCSVTGKGQWETVSKVFNTGSNINLSIEASVTNGTARFDCLYLQQTNRLYEEKAASLSAKAKRFTLSTKDTALTVAIENNKQYIEVLKNKETGYEWITANEAQEVPLVAYKKSADWEFKNADMNTSDGTQLRLTFVRSNPDMEMTVYWQAYPDHNGPVQYWATIKNKSNTTLRFNYSDIISGDFIITTDGDCTLNRFGRCNHAGADISNRVYQDLILPGIQSNSQIENQHDSEGVLPFQMIQSKNGHGLYYGYYWSFGEMSVTAQGDPNKVRVKSVLSSIQGKSLTRSPANGDKNGDGTEDPDLDLTIPGMFFGAYQGSMDNGSNRMKDWFWKNKMTKTLRENPNEPLVELHLPFNSEEEWTNYLNKHDVASWGVQLLKQDYWWTTPNNPPQDGSFNKSLDNLWEPYPTKWPNGMTLGNLAHSKNLKISLYMCDTYQGAPIDDWTGRAQNLNALSERLKKWNIDYYRSDLSLEGPNGSRNYAAHEGYLWILDSLMQDPNLPNFRYEHCSGGGALKDFTTLERASFLTTEDSARALQHRIVSYANTYMINPVQLKADIAIDWAPLEGSYTDEEAWDYYNFRTGLTGSMMVCSSTTLSGFTDHQIEVAKETYKLYNTKQRAILRNCNVYHILPSPDGVNWDGMEYYNDNIGKGSILLFRPGNTSETQKVIFPDGLKNDATYIVSFEDNKQLNCEKTGKELMEKGISVLMDTENDSEIIWLEEKNFKPVDDSILYGDLNHDKKVDANDALLALRHSVNKIMLKGNDFIAGDVNADKELNAIDALLILKRAVNKIPAFPCETK